MMKPQRHRDTKVCNHKGTETKSKKMMKSYPKTAPNKACTGRLVGSAF